MDGATGTPGPEPVVVSPVSRRFGALAAVSSPGSGL